MTFPPLGGLSVSWNTNELSVYGLKKYFFIGFPYFISENYNRFQYFSYICNSINLKIFTVMDEKKKNYAAPEVQVIDIELQGMIAASFNIPGEVPGSNLP